MKSLREKPTRVGVLLEPLVVDPEPFFLQKLRKRRHRVIPNAGDLEGFLKRLHGVKRRYNLVKLAGDLFDEVQLARGHEDRIFRPLAIDLQEANRLASVAGDAVDDAIERLRRNGRSVLGKEERRLSRVVSSFGTRHCQDIADSVRTPDAAVFECDGFS